MKRYQSTAILSTLIALTACGSSPQKAPEKSAEVAPELIKPSVAPTFVLRGEIVVGHEVRSFKPCGSNHQLWLDMPPELQKETMRLTRTPYQPLYGEVIGHLEVPSRGGFDADFAARFVVDSVNQVSAENPNRCDQDYRSTRAFGNEPFWSMSFDKGGLSYQRMGEEAKRFEIQKNSITPNQRTYTFDEGTLLLTKGQCNDTMSDSIYGWQSTLTIDEKELKGCATLSNFDATSNWSGTYQASSTQSSGFSITLTLDADHTAITRYDYPNNEPSIIEKGYWQQLTPDEVSVVMTRHQSQYLVSERRFTRQGYQLSATEEIVSGKRYPIANGGLTLFKSQSQQTYQDAVIQQAQRKLAAAEIPSSDTFDANVDAAIRDYFTLHRSKPNNTKYQWLTYDLNGDGQEELLVQMDWCGSGGCTLLIFENSNNQWRFNSRITQVRTPIKLASSQTDGWQDMIFTTSGGGYPEAKHLMKFTGISYPLNPTTQPETKLTSQTILFSDATSPQQFGITL